MPVDSHGRRGTGQSKGAKSREALRFDAAFAEEELQAIDSSEYLGAPKPVNEEERMDVLCGLNLLNTVRNWALVCCVCLHSACVILL